VPAAVRVESLGEEGAPMVVVDNTELIRSKLKRAEDFTAEGEPKQGCSVVDPLSLGLIALMAGLRRRRR
jgi:MYXO-CTERM domain-containing protein